tara:strand:+ start:296 stop:628 length:333 start_codon:yes stop_codon:yes gene_type:complete
MNDQATALIAALLSLFSDLRGKAIESNTDRCIAQFRADEIDYIFDLFDDYPSGEPQLLRKLRSEQHTMLTSDLTIERLKVVHAESLKLFWLAGGSKNDLKKEFNDFNHLV